MDNLLDQFTVSLVYLLIKISIVHTELTVQPCVFWLNDIFMGYYVQMKLNV